MIVLVHRLLMCELYLYVYLWYGDEYGWGGLFVLFGVGILMGSSLSFQTMEGVQMGFVLLNATWLLSSNFNSITLEAPPTSIWEVVTNLYDPCFQTRHLLIPSVLAASRTPSQRHMVLITWAVVLVLAIELPSNLFLALYTPVISETIVAYKIRLLIGVPPFLTNEDSGRHSDCLVLWTKLSGGKKNLSSDNKSSANSLTPAYMFPNQHNHIFQLCYGSKHCLCAV